ncbi:MAG: hypothetical protein K2Z81_27820, partial [Cyanobacteria bacterium]|nr:hypothetical protein [Cyanobacteriota bacterium]
TTAVCKSVINDRWVTDGRKNSNDWKRISKTGSAKTSIVRLFEHRSRPLFATVVEEGGEITSVSFSDTRPTSTAKPKARASDDGADEPAVAGRAKSNGKAVASDYLFAITHREGGYTYFAVCAEAYWLTENCLSDDSFGRLLDGLLPTDASESSECQYMTRLSKKALTSFMLANGFKQNDGFTEYMSDLY